MDPAFSEIAAVAPGLSRTLLTTRLRYHLTDAGEDLAQLMKALGTWGERWMELVPEHLDPGVVLHSWVSWYLQVEAGTSSARSCWTRQH